MHRQKQLLFSLFALIALIGFGNVSFVESQGSGSLTLQPQSGIIEVSTDGGSTFTQVGDPPSHSSKAMSFAGELMQLAPLSAHPN